MKLTTKSLDESKPFLDHLEELRKRLFFILILLAVLFFGSFHFVDKIISFLAQATGGFVFLSPTEAFLVRLKIAFYCGLFFTIPFILFEVWRFVAVALTRQERQMVLKIVPFSYLLFCVGVAMAWFVVIPVGVKFLMGFSTPDLRPLISIDQFLGFAVGLILAFGAMFQLPIVVILLVKLGIVSPQTLSHYRPHIIVGLAILAAFLTPGPDVFSQLMILIPTYLLFELSVLLARLYYR